jgi:hypothetical protein
MLIQCTKKLLDELNIKSVSPIEEEPLFSWHANLIKLNRRKTVVLVNDKNRYIVVLYGLKAKDFKKLDQLIVKAICETLKDECIKDEIIEQFINHSNEIVYAKTKDKTSVARMNKSCEVVYYYVDLLCNDCICQSELSKRVSQYFMGNGKNVYIYPNEEMFKDLEAFSEQPIFSCKVAVLKVTLDLEKHNVWRRLVVPLNMTFSKLHKVLQAAFGWKDYHLHEFYIYNESKCNLSINHSAYHKESNRPVINLVCSEEAFQYPNEIEMKLENGIKLSEYIPKYKRMQYNYDFGDDWQHYIKVEKIIDDYNLNYPICLEGEGNTPPEDVGGKTGYEEFLEIIADEKHSEYKNMLSWVERLWYKKFDIEMVNDRIKNY